MPLRSAPLPFSTEFIYTPSVSSIFNSLAMVVFKLPPEIPRITFCTYPYSKISYIIFLALLAGTANE